MTSAETAKLKQVFTILFKKAIEPLAHGVTAHAVVIRKFQETYPTLGLSAAVDLARANPACLGVCAESYQEVLEKLLQRVSESFLETEAFEEWLQTLKPEDWKN